MTGAPGGFPTPPAEVVGAILRGEDPPEQETVATAEPEPESVPAKETATADDSPQASQDGDAPPSDESTDGAADAGTDTDDAEQLDDSLTVRDIADKLGIKAADVYNRLRVGMPDGRGDVTIDELKRGYVDNAALEDQREEFALQQDEYRAQRDSDQLEDLRARQETATIMRFVNQLPPELIQQAQRAHTEEQSRQGELLIGARPEWRDPQVRMAAAEEHIELLAEFGIGRAEYQTIGDHRLILVADELAKLRRERREAIDKARTARDASKRSAPRTGNRRGAAAPQRRTRPKADPVGETVAQVGAILRGD